MQVLEYAKRGYAVALTFEEKSLFQQEADARPDFQVVDIASLIRYNLETEIAILKERYPL